MNIHSSVILSLSARLDKTNPKGIHIGEDTYVAFDAAILSHDMTRGMKTDTVIGKKCFVGARSIILPGVKIGDGCVIGSGSVVTKDIPSGCAAAGNPARVLRENIETLSYGRLKKQGTT
nr:acyltransferase [Roseibium album]